MRCEDNKMYDANPQHECGGAGSKGRVRCDYFGEDNERRCWRCWTFGRQFGFDPLTCPATRGDKDDCAYFYSYKNKKCRRK